MITITGKSEIGNMLAALYRGSLAVGVGTTAEADTHTKLDFEIFRAPVTVSAYEELGSRIVVKTMLPIELAAQITEVGIFSTSIEAPVMTTVATFSEPAFWTGTTLVTDNSRVGGAGMTIADTGQLGALNLELSGYSPNDIIEFAAHASAGGGTARIDFLTDDTNYLTHTFTLSAGYNIYRTNVSDLVAVGNPSQLISGLRIVKAGAGTLTADALRIHRVGVGEGFMLQRKVLAVPVTKIAGRSMDVELPVEVNINV